MRQNFSGKNFQGRSFTGQNLTGADFSFSDIRGTNFTNAILLGVNFSHAKAGIPVKRVVGLMLLMLFLTAICGFIGGFPSLFAAYLLFPYSVSPNKIFPALIVLTFFTIFGVTIARKGLSGAFLAVSITSIICGILLGMMTGTIDGIASGVVTITLTTLIIYGMSVTLAIAVSVVTEIAGVAATILTIGVVVPSVIVGAISGVTMGVKVAEVFSGVGKLKPYKLEAVTEGVIAAIFGSVALALFIGYICWRVFAGDEKFVWIRKLAILIASFASTSFRFANLTNSNFTQANLKNTDFRNACLTHADFHLVKELERARVDNTILIDSKVRDLVVTKRGVNKSYVRCNLKGANLANADLSYAELIEADISEATFEGALLEYTNFTKTQAIATDFQQAKLTGACLEAWNIDSTTNIEGVICDYIYLLNNQQERRPSSGEFAHGEFTKLFQVAINTVDLIFRNGLDLQALSAALAKVKVENEDTQLAVKSVENKGDGVVVVRVDVSASADKARIHADFIQNYEIFLKALEAKYQKEQKSKDEQIAISRKYEEDLKELIKMLAPSARKSPEGKLVVLKLGEGDLRTGFPVTLQIGLEGDRPSFESHGKLPPAAELALAYSQWQDAYRSSLGGILRLNIPNTQITNVSRSDLYQECNALAKYLQQNINLWLNSETFRPIKEQLLEKLTPLESIRIILQTEDTQLRRLPFQLWDFFERYPQAEIALSSPIYEKLEKYLFPNSRMRILAILGDSTGINVLKDRVLLEQLFNTEVTFLVEPQRQELNDELWQKPWDILFFAGHSFTETDREVGKIHINKNDTLTIPELKNAISKAIKQGLQLAIFNSCDGLGLAVNLADLHLPQIIVMREPVPDYVATEFLKNFLTEFSNGKPLYQSVREARSKLQGLEDKFPCATWLPVIYQNPAEIPLTWYQ